MRGFRTALLLIATSACAGGNTGGDPGEPDGGGPREPDASYGACEAADPGGFTYKKIGTWRDDAKAAYSMIHDDMCGPGLEGIQDLAVPALVERGLSAGLGPFVQACDENNRWDVVQAAEAQGMEIISHSYTHPEVTPENAAMEITQAKAAFDAKLQHPITFYIFPYDFWTPATLAVLESSGHLGARAGNRDDNDGFDNPPINPAEPTADLEIEFDVWPRSYSKYALYFPEDLLFVHIWNAIDRGGWAVREFHSVRRDDEPDTGRGFGPVPISLYEKQLDFLADAWAGNQVWTASPSTVLRYRHARTACTASVEGDTITFGTSNPDCAKYATPISVIVETGNDVPRIEAVQNGAAVSTRWIGPRTFSVTADPTLGSVTLSGCSNPGPAVRDVSLPPRPTPAASVCDIETVTGTGSPGIMDDLERPPEEFQVLPNPSQADGRTGTWSWYPQQATVEMSPDGGNTVLRYAATNLAAWTGATLAFLGGNGAGSCYDATAYTGIRFRMKGQVTGGDLAGKVILSVVTAETQTRKYGGDLDGEGGHFNKVLTISPTWQTVEVPFTSLDKPTWGATTNLTAVAVRKLQALDWGISNTATSFEVFLDDIELY
jgi:hypothetical protein